MSDGKGITTAVLAGRNRAERRHPGEGALHTEQDYTTPQADVEVYQSAAPQPGGPRPDGFVPATAPLPESGGEHYAQQAQREQVRSASPAQLAQTSRVGRR